MKTINSTCLGVNHVILFILIYFVQLNAQKSLLQSGPMNGYSAMREVQVWVQTTEEADVQLKYWEKGKQNKFESDFAATFKEDAFTAHITIENLKPGTVYNYELFINEEKIILPYELKFQTQKLWQWREDAPDFSFTAGSCFYVNEDPYDRPGKPYGDGFQIFNSITQRQPDFMLWLGDNIYLREVDWDSRSGILARYTHTRSFDNIQQLLGNTHNYATWDDHDYGPDNSDRGFWNKDLTLEAFKLFWANPTYGIGGSEGVNTFFKWSDCDFFLTDGRYYRAPEFRKNIDRELLGEKQIEWLIDALVKSEAPFKFIVLGTAALTSVANKESYETYKIEKDKLLKAIKEEKITGVIFITGDRHYTELTKMPRENDYPLYDFTISPLTSGVNTKGNGGNEFMVEGTHVQERNYALFEITGKNKNRILKCTIIDKDGKEIWNYSINENELK
ncbi:MAG: alkaline phosphatase family protein [Bacteroidetes bacterium]|nr:alkaline phosphatase family protein [Bacteroidota bacterium]